MASTSRPVVSSGKRRFERDMWKAPGERQYIQSTRTSLGLSRWERTCTSSRLLAAFGPIKDIRIPAMEDVQPDLITGFYIQVAYVH